MCEHSEFIAVVSVETILSPEPHESLIVLGDRRYARLGQALGERHPLKAQIMAVDYGQFDAVGILLRQEDGAGGRRPSLRSK